MTSQRAEQDRLLGELYAMSACRAARCGRTAIRWMPTAKTHPRTRRPLLSGRPVPLEVDRDPAGPVVLDKHPGTGEWQARPLEPDDRQDRPRYALHWQNCHTPELWLAVRHAADPRGVLPGLPVRGARRGPPERPCPRCGGTGAGVMGEWLCLDCARIVVRGWSAYMRPTIERMPADLRRVLLVEDLPPAG